MQEITIQHNGVEFKYKPLNLNNCLELIDIQTKIDTIYFKYIQQAERDGIDFTEADAWENQYNIYVTANEQRRKLLETETDPDKCINYKELIKKTEIDIAEHLQKKTKQIDDVLKLKEKYKYSAVIRVMADVNQVKPLLEKCLTGDLSKIDYSDTFFIYQCLNNLFFYSKSNENK
jgi:hypothetical protein